MKRINLKVSFVKYLKRHERLLVTIGALIIAGTFIVKEVLLEDAARMADSLSAAQTEYIVLNAMLQLHHEIDQVDGHVMNGTANILTNFPAYHSTPTFSADPESILNRKDVQFLRIQTETEAQFDSVGRLLEKLPSDDKNREPFRNLWLAWVTCEDSLLAPITPIGAKTNPDEEKKKSLARKQTTEKMLDINAELQMRSANIFDNARHVLRQKEHKVLCFTHLSYYFYAIGFIVTIISRIAGVEQLDPIGA